MDEKEPKETGAKLNLAVCDVESLEPQHRKDCEEAKGYIPPLRRYVDDNGVIHDPSYRLPTHNPENYGSSGIYRLEFSKKYKEDPTFRERMRILTRIKRGLD